MSIGWFRPKAQKANNMHGWHVLTMARSHEYQHNMNKTWVNKTQKTCVGNYSSSSLAAGMAGEKAWTDAEWAAWYAEWEKEEEQKNNEWYQPVAKEEPQKQKDNAGVVEPPHKKITLPVGPLHKAKDAGPLGAVPKACAGAPGGFGANNPGGAASGSSGNAGQPAAPLVSWILYRFDFVWIRFFLNVYFCYCLISCTMLALQAPWQVGRAKAADAGTVGQQAPVGQQVSDAIPAQYHQAYMLAAAIAAGAAAPGTTAGTTGTADNSGLAGTTMGAGSTATTAVPAVSSFAGYHWQDLAGNWHYWRQAGIGFFFQLQLVGFFWDQKPCNLLVFFGDQKPCRCRRGRQAS